MIFNPEVKSVSLRISGALSDRTEGSPSSYGRFSFEALPISTSVINMSAVMSQPVGGMTLLFPAA